MSDGRHPNLDDLYASIGDDELLDDDDDIEDADYEYYLDADDIEEEMDDELGEDDDDDDDDDDEDGEYGEGDEEGARVVLEVEDDEGDGAGDANDATFSELAALFNNTNTADARSSLLARLLAGPGPGSGGGAGGNITITRSGNLISRLLGNAGGGGGTGMSAEERARRAAERRKKEKWWTPISEPDPRGLELLHGGEFGDVGDWRTPNKKARHHLKSPVYNHRKRHIRSPPIAQATIPNTHGTVVAWYPSIPYVGQYAGEDYGVFYAATQYFTLHLYSTTQNRITPKRSRPNQAGSSNAPGSSPGATTSARALDVGDDDDDETDDGLPWGNPGGARRGHTEDTSMKKIKTVQGEEGRWTITDCDADKKGEKMIYSSITPYVHMLYTAEHESEHICLDFSQQSARRRQADIWEYDSFGIWSIRFSADGKEVVAGAGGGQIMVYDIEAERRSLSVSGHADDVNAVCFADESSTNILVSGSDDGYVKVWDRRSLSSSTPSGVLVGATEGITYTSPKGDGRYIVVNSKDQAARLYDLRKMRSHSEFQNEPDAQARYGQPRFDYRNSRYPPPARLAHPKDCSVMTFRGHAVLRTLIRCHFSPRESTGQNYIYSGSADGMIHIWSLDGRVVQVLNRAESTPLRSASGGYNDPSAPDVARTRSRPMLDEYDAYSYGAGHCVRDVAWHGYEPTLMSTCWEVDGGYRRGGTLAKHEWKGLGKGGMRNLEDWVEKTKAEQADSSLNNTLQ